MRSPAYKLLILFGVLGVLAQAPAVRADAPLSDESTDSAVVLPLTDRIEADAFAARIVARVRALGEGQKLVVRLTHFTENGRNLNPNLTRAIEIVDLDLGRSGLSSRIEYEVDVLDSADVEKSTRQTAPALPDEAQVERLVARYEKDSGETAPAETKRKIIDYLAPKNVLRRLGYLKNSLFGTPQGITVEEHFVVRDEATGKTQGRFRGARNAKMALSTALLAMTSFSVAVVKNPFWGFMDLGSFQHISSSAVLGLWVGTCLYYVRELVSFKTQGRAVRLRTDDEGRASVQIGTSRAFYMTSAVAQELLAKTVIMSGIVGGPLALMEQSHQALLVFIGAAALSSAFSAVPAESWAAGFFAADQKLVAEARRLRAEGNEAGAVALESQAEKARKKGGLILNLWWKGAFNILYWGGFTIAYGWEGSELSMVAKWFVGEMGLVGVATAGLITSVLKDRSHIVNSVKDAWERWRGRKAVGGSCSDQIELFTRSEVETLN